ncbi:hypothetical protein VN97_g3371 [Penicillium thymicola]|uniref:Uncharacterized protein n=1 Tax=Penicillium thymicola TaxID=293382 RepID=A0AAI9XAB7_PENTH|nr:hypothetical protein VN97_g3371 [Penicillium thymicola]
MLKGIPGHSFATFPVAASTILKVSGFWTFFRIKDVPCLHTHTPHVEPTARLYEPISLLASFARERSSTHIFSYTFVLKGLILLPEKSYQTPFPQFRRKFQSLELRSHGLSCCPLKVGYVTAYWGAKPKEAKLTGYSNSQVRRLHNRFYKQITIEG